MKKKMLQFVDLKQETPVKRSTSKRRGDFNEIYDQFITEKAKDQSNIVMFLVYNTYAMAPNSQIEAFDNTQLGEKREKYYIRTVRC